MSVRSFLKWAGGKRQLLPEILPRVPKHENYYEPFVGGGALFFALPHNRAFLSDANEELINTYTQVRHNVSDVIGLLQPWSYDRATFLNIRSWNTKTLPAPMRAARFIYLNRTCFNGLYRVNKKGQFNVPFGRYTNPTICDVETLTACSKALRDVSFGIGDFTQQAHAPSRGDFVYFDPPYVPVKATSSFTSYTEGGFKHEDQVRLRDYARSLKERGVHVMLSNSSAPLVYELYKDGFTIHEVFANRSINSKAEKRGALLEVIIQ